MKVIGIVGARSRNNATDYIDLIKVFNTVFEEGDTLVSGGCPKGGDRFAERIAKKKGISIKIHKPDWDKHGRGAGFVRNTLIAEDCDVLIAVVATDRKGGTEDTIKKVFKMGKPVFLVEKNKYL